MKKSIEGTKIVFTFEGLESYIFDTEKLSEQNRAYAVPFGMSHRLGDCAANMKTEQERRAAVTGLGDFYQNGAPEWSPKTRTVAQNPVFLDIANRRNCTYAEAETWYANNMIAEMQKLIDAGK